jgi:hypothetical protein
MLLVHFVCASDMSLEQKRLLLTTGCRYHAEGYEFFLMDGLLTICTV